MPLARTFIATFVALCVTFIAQADAAVLENCPPPQDGVRRVALVVGNSAYPNGALPGTISDAEKVAAAFCKNGFEYVDLLTDAKKAPLESSLAALRSQIVGYPSTRIAVFYYSGHGVEIAGENYVVPIDAPFTTGRELSFRSIGLGRDVLPKLGPPGPSLLRVVILDACRDNKLSQAGLSIPVLNPAQYENLLIATAGAPGQTVSGVRDGNSLYTWRLMPLLSSRTLDILKVQLRAQRDLYTYTQANHPPAPLLYPEVRVWVYDDSAYYTAPDLSAITAGAGPASDILRSSNAIWESSPGKRVEALDCIGDDCPNEGMSIEDLLSAAQDALREVLTDEAGKTRLDDLGNPILAPDFASAASYWKAAAKRGSASALRRLGDLYKSGRGVGQEPEEAFNAFRSAADQGDVIAVERLGDFYRDGIVVAQDYAKALGQYRRARDLGNAQAIADLAYMSYAGLGYGEPDYKRALRLFEEAEAKGVPEAASWIGWMYLAGKGTEIDLNAAVAAMKRADEAGDVAGMEYLSRLYDQGYAVERDKAKSDFYFKKALALVDAWYIKQYELDKD